MATGASPAAGTRTATPAKWPTRSFSPLIRRSPSSLEPLHFDGRQQRSALFFDTENESDYAQARSRFIELAHAEIEADPSSKSTRLAPSAPSPRSTERSGKGAGNDALRPSLQDDERRSDGDPSRPPARSGRCLSARCGTSMPTVELSAARSTTTRSRCSRSWSCCRSRPEHERRSSQLRSYTKRDAGEAVER